MGNVCVKMQHTTTATAGKGGNEDSFVPHSPLHPHHPQPICSFSIVEDQPQPAEENGVAMQRCDHQSSDVVVLHHMERIPSPSTTAAAAVAAGHTHHHHHRATTTINLLAFHSVLQKEGPEEDGDDNGAAERRTVPLHYPPPSWHFGDAANPPNSDNQAAATSLSIEGDICSVVPPAVLGCHTQSTTTTAATIIVVGSSHREAASQPPLQYNTKKELISPSYSETQRQILATSSETPLSGLSGTCRPQAGPARWSNSGRGSATAGCGSGWDVHSSSSMCSFLSGVHRKQSNALCLSPAAAQLHHNSHGAGDVPRPCQEGDPEGRITTGREEGGDVAQEYIHSPEEDVDGEQLVEVQEDDPPLVSSKYVSSLGMAPTLASPSSSASTNQRDTLSSAAAGGSALRHDAFGSRRASIEVGSTSSLTA